MFDTKKYTEIKDFIKKSSKITKIIAISKNHNIQSVNQAINFGVKDFGENRVQEAETKFTINIKKKNQIKLHLTGPLQTNKVRQALNIFDVFHTLDREKLLKELSKFPQEIKHKSFFIQVNTGLESSKTGINPNEVEEFLVLCKRYGIKNLLGLMCIPPINEDPNKHFLILDKIIKKTGLKGLSIGMSADYLDALNFNPIYIRLGTTLFGKRE